jgi:hypothetical protein
MESQNIIVEIPKDRKAYQKQYAAKYYRTHTEPIITCDICKKSYKKSNTWNHTKGKLHTFMKDMLNNKTT